MAPGTRLLNDDGSASMATLIMLSHHAFRRDLARFARALSQVLAGEDSRLDALSGEWQTFHAALHGHHQIEDTQMFPSMRSQAPALAAAIDQLAAQHHQIDPLLERGDRAFSTLSTAAGDAQRLVAELTALLDEHLTLEEASVIPLLRGAKEFPAPPDDAAAEMYAGGFAWSMHGIAESVLGPVKTMLPEILVKRLPAACEAFAARCERVWGSRAAGSSETSHPNG